MSRSKKNAPALSESSNGEDEKRIRSMSDYVFEEHKEDGYVRMIGLTMNYPSEAEKVKAWLEKNKESMGIEGTIRICRKIYA